LASKEKTLSQFEKEIEAPDFWSNPSQAQQVMKQYNITKAEVDSWRAFSRRLHDALELAQLEDESLRLELETEISAIESELEKRSFTAMLSGKYDHDPAILAIHAGAGGTDSQDWAAMLERMYLRWAEARGFETEILDITEGEEELRVSPLRSMGNTPLVTCVLRRECIVWFGFPHSMPPIAGTPPLPLWKFCLKWRWTKPKLILRRVILKWTSSVPQARAGRTFKRMPQRFASHISQQALL
jgi:hypothetical protein